MSMRTTVMVIALLGLLVLAGCIEPIEESTQTQGEQEQEDLMKKARAQVPTPQAENFLTRKAVKKWMERQDSVERLHYVYVFGNNGNIIGYYVAQNRPVSTCTFMTPPQREVETDGGANPLGQAPALDGVYYGDKDCDQWFFFDAETDAMIELRGFKFITSDQPLRIEADPLKVQNTDT